MTGRRLPAIGRSSGKTFGQATDRRSDGISRSYGRTGESCAKTGLSSGRTGGNCGGTGPNCGMMFVTSGATGLRTSATPATIGTIASAGPSHPAHS